MREVLVEEYRGNILECEYLGHICCVDEKGQVVFSVGDEEFLTYFRSSAKPIQVISVVKRGIPEKYAISEKEIAVMTGSHRAQSFHVEAVESVLKKINISEESFVCNPTYPLMESVRREMISKGMGKRSIYHNCSGKHSGILSLCVDKGCDAETYWDISNPAQQEILSTISEISEYPREEIGIGTDGCGVPVFAVPLKFMANAYMRLANPDVIGDNGTREAVKAITRIMNTYPEMVSGTGLICSVLLEDKNIIAKGGAKGVYCFGLKDEKLGFAIKVMDGSEHTWPGIIVSILEGIGYKNEKTIARLKEVFPLETINDNGKIVGYSKTVFDFRINGK